MLMATTASQLTKRVIDVAVSVAALLLLAPLLAALSIAIRLDSPGPVVFRQRRVGKDERLFTCYKFRTMYFQADDGVHKEAIKRLWRGERVSQDPDSPYKLTNDPRITPIGSLLRRSSLDELPQLINVLRGEMSIVGPRPAIPYELAFFQEWQHERHRVKPGLTGLWQVRGRGRLSLREMLELDVEYAKTWSVWTDLKLIVLTIPAVVRGAGAR